MEVVTGRLTANATVKQISESKQVVNFSMAVNDRYKTKGGEVKENTRYFQCAYWSGVGIAPYLTKGLLVELTGRIDLNVWNNPEGKAKGSLTMQVNNLKMHGRSNAESASNKKELTRHAVTTGTTDDLPF